MDRSRYNQRESWGDYLENSSNTPNFHSLKASGQRLPITDYFWYRIDGESPERLTYNGLATERDAAGIQTFYATLLSGYYTLQAGGVQGPRFHSLSEAHAILRNKLISSIRDSPIDLGVSLGEYRQTASLTVSAMKKTADLYRAVRKFDFSRALRVVTGRSNRRLSDVDKSAADAWLGFTYGVKPLMSDVYGACEVLTRDKSPWVGWLTTHGSLSYSVPGSLVKNSGGTAEGYGSGKVKGSAKLHYFVENPLTFSLDQIGVTNPLSIGWELIPFSFVCDWFLPIGEALRSVVPPLGLSSFKGYTYVKAEGGCYQATTIQGNPGWKTYAATREKIKDRKVLSSYPDFTFIIPDLSLSHSQLASGMALLSQLR